MPSPTSPPPRAPIRTVVVPVALADALGLAGHALSGVQGGPYREVPLPWSPTWTEAPLPGAPGWLCALRLALQAGRVVISELRVYPRETWAGRAPGTWSGEWTRSAAVPLGGIASRMLRIPLSRLVEQATQRPETSYGLADAIIEQREARPSRRRRPRRRPPPDVLLASIARHYILLCHVTSRRERRRPLEEMARVLGDLYSVRDLTRLIARARDRRLLTRLKQGKAGGELTAKAWRLLEHKAARERQGIYAFDEHLNEYIAHLQGGRTDRERNRVRPEVDRSDDERGASIDHAPARSRGGVRRRARVARQRGLQRRRRQRR